MKELFTSMLSEALEGIDPDQRMILDTGDGVAVTFLGDVDDALFVTMRLREQIRAATAGTQASPTDAAPPFNFDVRAAINLGPIRLLRDALGHPSVVGDGVSVAQRIVAFAQSGQIIASRSYFENVTKISQPFAKVFAYEGSRTDKHVREHEIYVVGEADRPLGELFDKSARVPPAKSAMATLTEMPQHKKLIFASGGLAVVVLGLILALAMRSPGKKPDAAINPPVTTASVAAPTTPVAPAVAPLPPSVNSTGTTAAAIAAAASKDGKATPPLDPEAVKVAEEKKLALARQGTILFNISPWGNVSINGSPAGTSPPMKQTRLAPGKYRIEVRNSDAFAPYVVEINLKSKEEIALRHRFQ